MKRADLITLGIMAAIILIAGVYAVITMRQKQSVPLSNLTEDERSFINTSYTTMSGEPVSLSDYIGDVVVASAWASWCPACATELPDLERLARSYHDRGVHVVAVNRSEPAKTAADYLRSISIPTTGVMHVWLDENDAFYRGINGVTMPETVVYATDGTVFSQTRGSVSLDELKALVEQALAAKPLNNL